MAQVTWILVANASKARLFKSEKPYREMKLIKEFNHPESRAKAMNLVADGHGRYSHSTGTAPSGLYEEPTSPKQLEAERFAHELARELNLARIRNKYSNLIFVISPQFHGLLKKHCDSHVLNLVISTLDKDYTKLSQHDLMKYLDGKILWHVRNAAA
jgi:protein required for attachment to host cells